MENEILEGYRKRDPETGLIFPWYTWPCLEWLNGLDLKEKSVFEYGVGDSTKWYRAKAYYVRGVDSNEVWAQLADAVFADDEHTYRWMPFCVGGRLTESGEIIPRKWDIIIIDGIYRDECTKVALGALKPGGYLIIDNYKQPSVEPDWPLTEKLIEGMPITIYKQPGHSDWVTAVITKP